MKEIKRDKKIAQEEAVQKENRDKEKEDYDKAMKDFRKSPAYKYIIEFFDKAEKRIVDEIESQQKEEMKKVFIMTPKEQQDTIIQMSKRNSILTGVLSVLKKVKERV